MAKLLAASDKNSSHFRCRVRGRPSGGSNETAVLPAAEGRSPPFLGQRDTFRRIFISVHRDSESVTPSNIFANSLKPSLVRLGRRNQREKRHATCLEMREGLVS